MTGEGDKIQIVEMTADVRIDPKDLNLSAREPPLFYLTTVQSSTASFHSTFANFTGPTEHNLIINKGTKVEIYDVIPGGVIPKIEIPILGRISVMKSFRPTSFDVDLLAFITEKGDFFVFGYLPDDGEILTLVHANVNSSDCQPNRTAQLLSIDTSNHFIAVHVSVGIVQLISYEISGTNQINFKKAYPLRIMELDILDMSFVDSVKTGSSGHSNNATLAVLHSLPFKLPRIKTYEVVKTNNNVYSLTSLSYSLNDLSIDTSQIVRVPSPRGGFLVIAPDRIIYTNSSANIMRKIVFIPTYFTAVAPIDSDGFRFILGSSTGEFFILLLLTDQNGLVSEIKYEKLGRTSVASCLTYIDDGYVYVGSQYGDSQLIQLSSERVPSDSMEAQFLRIIHKFPCLSPLNDFAVIKPNVLSEQNILVASSGSAKDGSIKIVSTGIEAISVMSAELTFGDSASINADQSKCIAPSSIFAFKASAAEDSKNHSHLAISSLGQTLIFAVDPINGVLEEVAWGLHSNDETINLVQLESGHLPQVTNNGIYLGYPESVSCGGMWNCKPNERVLLSSNFENNVLLAMSDHSVRLFQVTPSGFSVLATGAFDHEVSGMKIFKTSSGKLMAVASFWDLNTFGFLNIDLETKKITLPNTFRAFKSEAVIRSIQVIESPTGELFVVLGGGNGEILMFPVPQTAESPVEFSKICTFRLGSRPVSLHQFDDRLHLIAQSDRPFHLTWHHSSKKFLCSAIEMPFFDCMCQFNFGDQVGFVTIRDKEIKFSYLKQSATPKVSIKTIPFGKSIHKVIYLPESGVFAAIFHNYPVMSIPSTHWPLLRSELVLLDDETFEIKDRYELLSGDGNSPLPSAIEGLNLIGRFSEIGWSISAGCLESSVDIPKTIGPVLVLGTSLTTDEPKDEKGRILVFKIGEGQRLKLISSNEMKGGVKVVTICDGHVIGCVRGLNVVYKWDYQVEKKLIKASSNGGHVDGTCLAQMDNILCIGDSLTSVSFSCFDKSNFKISEFARDFQDNYISAIQMIDHSSVIAADLTGNLMIYQVVHDKNLNMNAAICEGNVHLGDQITQILPGDLRAQSAFSKRSYLAVSSTGSIYALHKLDFDLYKKLLRLQKNLLGVLKPIGGIKHADFRNFYNGERSMNASSGFIDGDLLGRFLGLSSKAKNDILGLASKSTASEKIGFSVSEATNIIESLSYGI